MRSAPPPPPESVEFQTSALETVTRSYRFLTYVFGGGVKTREHERFFDERTPVRAASIRGQLRFWWRACNPRNCSTVEELYRAEEEVWGSTSKPSQVSIEVIKNLPPPQRIEVFQSDDNRLSIVRGMAEIAYGAFPLQPSRKARRSPGSRPGVLFNYGGETFDLLLRFPAELTNDVHIALWAWEHFGGLGSRTRRGFGAVERVTPKQEAFHSAKVTDWDTKRIPDVPSLTGARFAWSAADFPTPLDAWKAGIGRMQTLRQGVRVGRNPPGPGSRRPGRSCWPEPDEIRKIAAKSAPKHRKRLSSVDAFPRAAFGMPIVFHFHPGLREDPPSIGDPDADIQLQPEQGDRFGSPVILRPMADGRRYRAAALVLSVNLPPTVLQVGKKTVSVRWSLTNPEAATLPVLRDEAGIIHRDPIDRLLEEIKK
jgi:CRISPR-associated protein Cmr1